MKTLKILLMLAFGCLAAPAHALWDTKTFPLQHELSVNGLPSGSYVVLEGLTCWTTTGLRTLIDYVQRGEEDFNVKLLDRYNVTAPPNLKCWLAWSEPHDLAEIYKSAAGNRYRIDRYISLVTNLPVYQIISADYARLLRSIGMPIRNAN